MDNMKRGTLHFAILIAVLSGLNGTSQAQCNPDSDPNCFFSLLPAAPPPPDSTQTGKLAPDTAIKFAYDVAKGGQSNPTGEVMDVAIAAISVGYPPAGIALGVVKGLIDSASSGPDPVGEALKQINLRLDGLQSRLQNVEATVDALHNQVLSDENLNRKRWLQQDTDIISTDTRVLSAKPTDKAELARILSELENTADHFIQDSDRWLWSDLHVHADPHGVAQSTQMAADFKALPTFEVYSHALVLWMSALQYASEGDPGYITRNKSVVNHLLKHAAFLSVRPGWNRVRGGNPLTLPEEVMFRSQCSVEVNSSTGLGAGQYADPKTGLCYARIKCADLQRHSFFALPQGYASDVTWRPNNPKTDMCTFSLGRNDQSPADAAEAELAKEGGVEAMGLLADKLRLLAKQGALAEQFIGRFDMTFYSKEYLYGIKPNGELLWYGHQIGVDKNGPQPTNPGGPSRVLSTNPAAAARNSLGTRVTTPTTARNDRVTAATAGGAIRPPAPKVVHKVEGPKLVGSGWQNFRDVIPAGHTSFYALAADGSLLWYRHDGTMDGSPTWKGPIKVGSGWNSYTHVFGGGDGIIYAVGADGSLNWYRRPDYDNATTVPVSPAPVPPIRTLGKRIGTAHVSDGTVRIATGWGAYSQVFSTGQGIIYAITQDGRLLWFQHSGYLAGQPQLSGPKQVGNGWMNLKRVFSPGAGVIYAVTKTGEVLWYQHDGYTDGTSRWQGPTKIAADWSNFTMVFPHMWGTPQQQVIH